jgi:uncharacterized membrane protein
VSHESRRPQPFDYVTILVLGGVFVATWALYDRLPDPMPTHFGVRGTADRWMPRPFGAWLLPVATLVLGAVFRVGEWLLPRQLGPSFRAAPVAGYTFVFVAMLSGLHLLILRASLGPTPRLDGNVWVLGGLALAVMGQLMPRTGRNALFGFRTKWSMASDENWRRAQHAGASAFAVCGVAMAALGALGFSALAFASLLLMGVWTLAWSWAMGRRHPVPGK